MMRFSLILLLIGVLSTCVMAQQPNSKSNKPGIRLKVFEASPDNPLAGAKVVILNGKDSVQLVTDREGMVYYSKRPKEPKIYFVASLAGYETRKDSLIVKDFSIDWYSDVNFYLKKSK